MSGWLLYPVVTISLSLRYETSTIKGSQLGKIPLRAWLSSSTIIPFTVNSLRLWVRHHSITGFMHRISPVIAGLRYWRQSLAILVRLIVFSWWRQMVYVLIAYTLVYLCLRH